MARELPIHNGRLTTDLDADGHRIVNIPGGGIDTVSWDNVTGKPEFAPVATSGNYADLNGKPTIPPAVTVDDTVTRTSANPVKSSGIWGAIWGALTVLPKGFASLYDWCVAQLAGKLDGFPCSTGHIVLGNYNGTGELSDSGLSVDDIALAADLRYRIAEAGLTARLPTGVTFMDSGLAIECNLYFDAIVSKWIISPTDIEKWIFQWDADGTNGAESADYYESYALMQNGSAVQPSAVTLDLAYALADRTVNLITATDETSIDIELPEAVEDPTGVYRARDFILDVDNSQNANDLALEFTKLGDDIGTDDAYAFVTDAEDSIGEMTTVEKNTRVRLYFTETAYTKEDGAYVVPVFHVARVTLGDFVTSATQGDN